MARDFPGLPDNIYQYENAFNYSVWTPNSTILMCNVPWDSSYRDVVRFDADKERDAWFASRSADGYAFTLNGLVYLRYGEPIRVNAPFDMVTRCNYMVVSNPIQPVPPSSGRVQDKFYYFITDAKYLAPNTTQINVQLDVWMTYYNRVEFNMCYINRGHIAIANENSTEWNIPDYLTDAEGLETGDEYDIVHQEYINLQAARPACVIVSTADLEGAWGTTASPSLKTAGGSYMDGVLSGCATYIISAGELIELMEKLSDAPWVSQCIQSIQIIPNDFAQRGDPVSLNGVTAYRIARNKYENNLFTQVLDVHKNFDIPNRYRNLDKFFMYPYCVMEMTAHKGGEVVLKPECLAYGSSSTPSRDYFNLNILVACTPPDIRAVIYPKRYNTTADNWNDDDEDITYDYQTGAGDAARNTIEIGEYIDFGLTFGNFAQISVVNNMYQYYLASNRNQIAYQFASADWSYNKAMYGAQTSYNQASNNMNTALANQNVANAANWTLSGISQEKNLWNGVQGMVGSGVNAIGSLASGDVGSAAAGVANVALGAANTALNSNWINQTTSAQVGAATQTTQNNVANQGYTRDTNYDYAAYAAQGDYMNAIQGIQAKVRDMQLTQPTTSGQFGGDTFNVSEGLYGVLIKWKRIKPNYIRQVGDFWLRYGYYVNRWITPPQDLKCMENFTYWKMQSVALSTTEVPEVFKEAIRGIFEKGVTVWSDPDKMYRVDLADNDPVEGVSY